MYQDHVEPWRLFWAIITFIQGMTALCCDIGNGYTNTTIAQKILIIYSVIVSILGTYQYLTDYFYFMKNKYFDSHLIGNLILGSWLLGLFESGWIIGIISITITTLGLIFRLINPYDPYDRSENLV